MTRILARSGWPRSRDAPLGTSTLGHNAPACYRPTAGGFEVSIALTTPNDSAAPVKCELGRASAGRPDCCGDTLFNAIVVLAVVIAPQVRLVEPELDAAGVRIAMVLRGRFGHYALHRAQRSAQPGFQQCLRSQLCGLVLSHRRRTHLLLHSHLYTQSEVGHQEERVHDDDAVTVVVMRSRTYDSQWAMLAAWRSDVDAQDHAQGRRGILRKAGAPRFHGLLDWPGCYFW